MGDVVWKTEKQFIKMRAWIATPYDRSTSVDNYSYLYLHCINLVTLSQTAGFTIQLTTGKIHAQ
jgi:hypothetical protein